MKRRWLRRLFLRRVLVALMILLQVCSIVYIVSVDTFYARAFAAALRVASVFVVLYIVSRKTKPAYRLMWIILILALPVLGCLAYLLFNFQASTSWPCSSRLPLPLWPAGATACPPPLRPAPRPRGTLPTCKTAPISR